MRRTAGVIVGLGVLLALSGVATAGTYDAAADRRATQITAARAEAADGPERVGTTDEVAKVLGYLTPHRSMTFRYPGASYVKLHFIRLALLPGDYVTVADAHGRQESTYRAAGRRWAMSVDGDTAVLTLHRRGGPVSTVDNMGVVVDKVAHGYTPAQRSRAKGQDVARRDTAIKDMRAAEGQDARTEEVCGTSDMADAVCYRSSDPVAYKNSHAVARILINGDELCTAWRVGPNDRMFTNHHCFTSTAQARDTEVWFNYECTVCGGYVTDPVTKVWGDQVLATNSTLDFTLFTVQNFPAITRYGYLNVDNRDPNKGEQLYIAQHPGGDPTMIAIDSDEDPGGNCQIQDPATDGYGHNTDVSYLCDTAGGSSGSPVISRATNRVIALHHFGGCPNAGVRMDLILRQVGRLL